MRGPLRGKIMRTSYLELAAVILGSAMALAAQALPAGTALPIMLGSTLNARNDKPGQKLEGKLMQELRLPDDTVIKKGSRVSGQVISVQKPSRITIRFDSLQDEHQAIPLNVSLRALAASESVFQAGLPADASSSEESDEWVTMQVGGDYVFRGRGYVSSDQGKIGRWDGTGVWGKLQVGDNCVDSDINGEEQALWIFSATACGAYGFEKKTEITHDGSADPVGQITLQSEKEVLVVRGGSGWLLLVNPAAKPGVGSASH